MAKAKNQTRDVFANTMFSHDSAQRREFGNPPFDPNPPPSDGKGGGDASEGKGEGKPQTPKQREALLKKLLAQQAKNAKSTDQEHQGGDTVEGYEATGEARGGDRVDLDAIERKLIRERDQRRKGY